LDAFVIDAHEQFFPRVLQVAGTLRRAGFAADYSYKRQAIGKQFKQASSRAARCAVIVGQELSDRGVVALKDLASGVQRETPLELLLSDPLFAEPRTK
jgi:histidyl-tRNA synthetase